MKDLNVDLIIEEMIKEIEKSKQLLYLNTVMEQQKIDLQKQNEKWIKYQALKKLKDGKK